jgi:hypothetical protein
MEHHILNLKFSDVKRFLNLKINLGEKNKNKKPIQASSWHGTTRVTLTGLCLGLASSQAGRHGTTCSITGSRVEKHEPSHRLGPTGTTQPIGQV